MEDGRLVKVQRITWLGFDAGLGLASLSTTTSEQPFGRFAFEFCMLISRLISWEIQLAVQARQASLLSVTSGRSPPGEVVRGGGDGTFVSYWLGLVFLFHHHGMSLVRVLRTFQKLVCHNRARV